MIRKTVLSMNYLNNKPRNSKLMNKMCTTSVYPIRWKTLYDYHAARVLPADGQTKIGLLS